MSDKVYDGLTQEQAHAYDDAVHRADTLPTDPKNRIQLGRIVHFTKDSAPPCYASLVVHVWDKAGVNGCANLAVFDGNGQSLGGSTTSVVRRPAGDGFGWHWPNECPRP